MSMPFLNYYWCFSKGLSSQFCDDVVELGKGRPEVRAFTGTEGKTRDTKNKPFTKDELSNLKQKRDSHVVWMSEPWIYNTIHPFIREANIKAGWNFQWDWTEPCQFTKYGLNQFYGWHMDSWDNSYTTHESSNQSMQGKIRKLSAICQLVDPSEYEGGQVEFDLRTYEPHLRDESQHIIELKELRPKGTIIVFPSHIWHRVQPVTKGTRYSLVIWNLGDPFK